MSETPQGDSGGSWWSSISLDDVLGSAGKAVDLRNRWRQPAPTSGNDQAVQVPPGTEPRIVPAGPTFMDTIGANAQSILVVSVGLLILALAYKKISS